VAAAAIIVAATALAAALLAATLLAAPLFAATLLAAAIVATAGRFAAAAIIVAAAGIVATAGIVAAAAAAFEQIEGERLRSTTRQTHRQHGGQNTIHHGRGSSKSLNTKGDGNGNDIHTCRRNRRPRVARGNCGGP
jgi:hypothetical protein